METFYIPIAVGNLDGTRFVEMDAEVGTRATHTVVPGSTLAELGVNTAHMARFELADSTVVEYPVGYAKVRLGGKEVRAMVVFAPEGTLPAVGETTLEMGHLAPDPVEKRLVRVNGYLLWGFSHRPTRSTSAANP